MSCEHDLNRWERIFDLANLKTRLDELEQQASQSDLWQDAEKAQLVLRERSELSENLSKISGLEEFVSDGETYLELYSETKDEGTLKEFELLLNKFQAKLDELELERMLSGEHDAAAAILEINSGAGGTEAQDWGEMLLRMYTRFAERRGYSYEILSINPGEEAGLKNVTLIIQGKNAYGFLKAESGVHRLVRISPFDSNARRHTSFASVMVIPDVEEDIDIKINEDDLRIDTYRSSGAGGQHVNKTDSAVRITHMPSGIVIACQNERSQHKNKARAMRLLQAKLLDLERQKQQDQMDKIAGERKKIDFGSQIRSYVLQPYQLVKDVRTSYETSNTQGVLDGEIDEFIKAYLLSEV